MNIQDAGSGTIQEKVQGQIPTEIDNLSDQINILEEEVNNLTLKLSEVVRKHGTGQDSSEEDNEEENVDNLVDLAKSIRHQNTKIQEIKFKIKNINNNLEL